MFSKSILTAAAVVLVVGVGSATAAEQYPTIEGLDAEALTATEMTRVKGSGVDTASLVMGNAINAIDIADGHNFPGLLTSVNAGALNAVTTNPSP